MILHGNDVGGGVAASYQIDNSLRFRASASAYLSRTFGSPTSRKKYTLSLWVKRGVLATMYQAFIGAFSSGSSTYLGFSSYDKLYWRQGGIGDTVTNAVFRDPSAHYHVVFIIDTASATSTHSTSSSRIRIYVNGVQQATSGILPPQNTDTIINTSGLAHRIGNLSSVGNYLDGYLSEINFIDGQALDPSHFGEESTDGVWVPKAYEGTYGNNGFCLDFKDNSSVAALGHDAAGSNDWTCSNISLTPGVTYDHMLDTPTNVYATANSVDNYGMLSSANLTSGDATNGPRPCVGTVGVSAGKWYWEITPTAAGGTYSTVFLTGIISSQHSALSPSTSPAATTGAYTYYGYNGQKVSGSSWAAYGAAYSAGVTIGFALDMDAGTITCYRNGVSQGVMYSGLSGTYLPFWGCARTDCYCVYSLNFGQAPLHASATWHEDARGYFRYAPPTGFKALCTANLPEVTIPNPAEHFDAQIYAGTGTSKKLTTDFPVGLIWAKSRAVANHHGISDIVRGVGNELSSSSTNAEYTRQTGVTSFDADGVTLGTSSFYDFNRANNHAAWLWKANGAGVTNNAGTITSTVSANQTAGFSIVTYTGTGSAGATVGHGLGAVPAMVIAKNRQNAGYSWGVYHKSIAATEYLLLNSTAAKATGAMWNNTAPSSSVITLGASTWGVNEAQNIVLYAFAEIPGYSKFGSYVGNGNTDGPFVFCGFRPRWVMVKCSSNAGANPWMLYDSTRDTYNVSSARLQPNSSNAEDSVAFFDFTANGFKVRTTGTSYNGTGETYIFAAFAEHPMGGSNISPSPAR